MAEENTYCCCEHDRDEVQLSEEIRPSVVIVDEDGCGCGCEEVELEVDHQPDIVVFEDYCDQYIDDIVAAKEAAEAALAAVNTGVTNIRSDIASAKSAIQSDITSAKTTLQGDITSAKNAVQSDISTQSSAIKDKIDADVATLSSAITTAKGAITSAISSAVSMVQGYISSAASSLQSAINNKIDSSTTAIRGDIANISVSVEIPSECSEQDIYGMFSGDVVNRTLQFAGTVTDGNLSADITVNNRIATFN